MTMTQHKTNSGQDLDKSLPFETLKMSACDGWWTDDYQNYFTKDAPVQMSRDGSLGTVNLCIVHQILFKAIVEAHLHSPKITRIISGNGVISGNTGHLSHHIHPTHPDHVIKKSIPRSSPLNTHTDSDSDYCGSPLDIDAQNEHTQHRSLDHAQA